MGKSTAFLESPYFWKAAAWQKSWVIEAGYDRGLSPLIKSPVLVINYNNNIIADSHKLHCSWSRKRVGKITFLFRLVKKIEIYSKTSLINQISQLVDEFGGLTTILPLFSVVVRWHYFHSSSTYQSPPDRLDTSICSVSPTWLLVSQVGETWSVRIEGLSPTSAAATQLWVATVRNIVTTMTFLSHHRFAAVV